MVNHRFSWGIKSILPSAVRSWKTFTWYNSCDCAGCVKTTLSWETVWLNDSRFSHCTSLQQAKNEKGNLDVFLAYTHCFYSKFPHASVFSFSSFFFLLFFKNEGVRNFFFFFLGDLVWLSGVWASPIFSFVVIEISTVSEVFTLSLDTSMLRSSSISAKWSFPLGIVSINRWNQVSNKGCG